MRLPNLSSPNFMLGALVVLAMAGSFFVPQEWFLLLNPASAKIDTLRENQEQLEVNLSEKQRKLRHLEQSVLLAESRVEEYEDTLMQLVRRQFSVNVAHDLLGSEFSNQRENIVVALEVHDSALDDLLDRQSKFDQIEIEIVGTEKEIDAIISRLNGITQKSTKQYLAMRAVALGALGAFAAALAAFLRVTAPSTPSTHLLSGRTMLSMVFGGIVALVVFALFTTRELSVFVNNGAPPDEIPDYWRVVILCLIAGAFADRLFAAARERVEHVTRGRGKANDVPPAPPV